MALRDFWRRDRDEAERTRFPVDPLSRDSWHDDAEARYGAQPNRNQHTSDNNQSRSFNDRDNESRGFNNRWENSYSGPGYQRFGSNADAWQGGREDQYGGSSNNPFLGDHPLARAGSTYDSNYFGANGIPRTRWRGDESNQSYDELVYGGNSDNRSNELSGEHRGRGPRGYQRSDERIKEDVCQCLTDDQHIDATNIEVVVKDREVILTGTVQSRGEKRHAEDLIERLAGVRDVINSLRVAPSESSAPFARGGL